MNNKDINLSSYEGVEERQLNRSEPEIMSYFEEKMASAKSDAAFIQREMFSGGPLKVCEIGSGNSKLLYALEEDGIFAEGGGRLRS